MILAALTICASFALFPVGSAAEDGVISLNKKAILYTKNAKTDAEYVVKDAPGITDGASSDNWAFGEFGEMYAQIDLQKNCVVSAVCVQAYSPYNHAWSIYLSSDGENFTKAADVPTTAMTAEGITTEFTPAEGRYVRVYADYYVTLKQFSFREVTVYGSEPEIPVDPVISEGKSGILYTKNAKTDTEYVTKTTTALTDGRTNDNWVFGAFGTMYAQIDLETVFNVSGVNVIGYAPYKHAWTVFLSEDGVTFTEAAGVSTVEHPAEGITVYFEALPARYVRVVADYYVTSEQFSFREVTVRGTLPPAQLYPVKSGITVTLPDGSVSDVLTNGITDDLLPVSGARGGYATVDLGSVNNVDRIVVYAYENNSAYAVYGSVDGASWKALGFKALNSVSNTTNGWEYVLETEGSFRYIRVQWAASTRNDGYLTIKEIDIFSGDSEYTNVTVTNVGYVYNNQNADDGNYTNYTFYKKADGYVTVDLGEKKDVRRIELYAQNGCGIYAEYSEDGASYTVLGARLPDDENDPASGYVYELDYSSMRYLRLTCAGTDSTTMDLSEILFYSPDHTHDWTPGAVTKKATFTEEGARTYLCPECGEEKSEVIPAATLGFHTEAPVDRIDAAAQTRRVAVIGTLTGNFAEEVDLENVEKLTVTLTFVTGGATVRSYTVDVRNVYSVVTGVALTEKSRETRVAQGYEDDDLALVSCDLIYAVTVSGVPTDCAFDLTATVAIAGGDPVATETYALAAIAG